MLHVLTVVDCTPGCTRSSAVPPNLLRVGIHRLHHKVKVEESVNAVQVSAVLPVELIWRIVYPQILYDRFFLDVGVSSRPLDWWIPEVFRGPYEYSVPGAKRDFLPQNQPQEA